MNRVDCNYFNIEKTGRMGVHMSSIKLYGLNACDTCRKARKLLDALKVDYTFTDLREEAARHNGQLSSSLVQHFFDQAPWETLINKRSTTWRQLSDEEKASLTSQKSAVALAIQHPTLLKRPLLDDGKSLVVGLDEQAYKALV